VFETDSPADRHALARLAADRVGWLTTVTPDGQPQTAPVWFLWDAGSLLIYGDMLAKRNGNIAANPRVSFHLDGGRAGHDVVVIEGAAGVDASAPALPDHAGYCARYADWIAASYGSPAGYAERYNVPIRITPTRGRVWAPDAEAGA